MKQIESRQVAVLKRPLVQGMFLGVWLLALLSALWHVQGLAEVTCGVTP